MISGSLARRYARALLELGQEAKQARLAEAPARQVEVIGEGLEKLTVLVGSIPGALATLANHSFPQAERLRVIEEIADRVRMEGELKNFLCLLVKKERIALLPEIVREYRALSDDLLGVIRVKVFTPGPPSDELLRSVEKLLHDKLRKKIVVKGISNPSLLGGMVMEVGHQRFDGSIRRHLEKMREDLIHGSPATKQILH